MNIDRKQVLEFQQKKTKDQKDKASLFLKQTQIQLKHLTEDPNWDKFLSFIQTDLEQLSSSIESYRGELSDPKKVDYNEIIVLKMELYAQERCKEMLERVIGFPKEIIDIGKSE